MLCKQLPGARAIPLIDLEHVDWSRFRRLVQFHRIEGLAWNYLAKFGQLPAPTAERLKNDATVIRARNLWAAAKSGLLRQCFEQANIPLVFLKGLTLSALAYGNPLIKSAIDVDVLIDPRRFDSGGRNPSRMRLSEYPSFERQALGQLAPQPQSLSGSRNEALCS